MTLIRRHLLVAAALFAVTLAVYARTLPYPFLNWDDDKYVTENSTVRDLSPQHLRQMFARPFVGVYVPLTMLTFALNYHFSHLDPRPYRAVNILLHALNAVLVYALVWQLSADALAAAGTALLFIVHPVQPESVIWVSQRKQVLSTFFMLASLLVYADGAEKTGKIRLLASWALFMAACFAKGMMVVLPAVLVAHDYVRGRLSRRDLGRYVPFAAGAAVFSFLTLKMIGQGAKGLADLSFYGGSPVSFVLMNLTIWARYFHLLVIPRAQSVLYVFAAPRGAADPAVLLSAGVLAAAGIFLAWSFRRDRRLFFWLLFFLIFLVPVSNVLPTSCYMQDRWLYVSLIGFFAAALLALRRALGARATVGLLVLALGFYTGLNFKRQEVWAGTETFWRDAVEKAGRQNVKRHLNLYVMHLNLAGYYFNSRRLEESRAEYEKALALYEEPSACYGLGQVYYRQGKFEKAEAFYKKALEKAAGAEVAMGLDDIHSGLAMTYDKLDRPEESYSEFEKALAINPGNKYCRSNYGFVLVRHGRRAEAEQQFLEALRADPDYPDALFNLGLLYHEAGRFADARSRWERLVRIHPSSPLSAQARGLLVKMAGG